MVDPTCLLVLRLTWSYLKVLKSIPPTQAFTSPVIGSIAMKPACVNSRWYLIESYGVMTVSLERAAFHAKTFIGVFTKKVALISLSLRPSSARLRHLSLFFIAASKTCSYFFHTEPFFIKPWLITLRYSLGACCATASSA